MARAGAEALLLACLAGACAPRASNAADPVIAAAGDIACDPGDPNYNAGSGTATACRMKATSDLLVAVPPDAVLVLGDDQYEDGALAKFQASYDATWGRVKAITRPVAGNHEYGTPNAAGYFSYFGGAAGDPAKGWYSFDLGAWHLVVLNSSCGAVGGCGTGSPQIAWLAADLAAHPNVCTLAAWHQPRFSSGAHGDDPAFDAIWRTLYDAGADVVLNGHDHDYERFDPQDPDAVADGVRGIRAFVVGTGGKNQTAFGTIRANSAVRSSGAFGVLTLTLHPSGYDWNFVPAAGGSFTDSGSGACHRAPRPTAFHTLPPCRIVDTRDPDGPRAGPALGPGTRSFPVTGACGVPPTATAVALNVTAVNPTADGTLRLSPSGLSVLTSTLSLRAGRVRASAAIAGVGAYGGVAVEAELPAGASTGLLLDVSGWFE